MISRGDVSAALKTVTAVRFDPNADTAVVFATLCVFWPIYYVSSDMLSLWSFGLFLVVGNLFLNVLFPVYYVVRIRGGSMAAVGLTSRGWWRALLVSTVLGIASVPGLLDAAGGMPTRDLLVHVLAMGLIVWEPFFVHCWLQLRYERAFGPLPGILLAGGSFGLYHVGTFSLALVLELALVGIVSAVVFRIVYQNLLVLWPLYWAIAASIGTLEGGVTFGWLAVVSWAVILVVTGIGVWMVAREGAESADSNRAN